MDGALKKEKTTLHGHLLDGLDPKIVLQCKLSTHFNPETRKSNK